jgi:hypothetical protein
MVVGTQFTGTVAAQSSHRWFTWGWPASWQTIWTVVPTTPAAGAPQLEWDIAVERASGSDVTYWVTIKNLTNSPIGIEARYAIPNI